MSRKINRFTKLVIGVVIFIMICLIVGLTLYFVLSKKKHSGSYRPTPTGPIPIVPTHRSYEDAKRKANNIKSDTAATFSNLENSILPMIKSKYTTAVEDNNISWVQVILVDYLSIYNQSVISIKSKIQDVYDLYNFIGDYQGLTNKKSFETDAPAILDSIKNEAPTFSESDIMNNTNKSTLNSYFIKISSTFSRILTGADYIVQITGGIIEELP